MLTCSVLVLAVFAPAALAEDPLVNYPVFDQAQYETPPSEESSPPPNTPESPNIEQVTEAQVSSASRSVDLTRWSEVIGDQSQIGSCTSWATAYGLTGWWANKLGRKQGYSYISSSWLKIPGEPKSLWFTSLWDWYGRGDSKNFYLNPMSVYGHMSGYKNVGTLIGETMKYISKRGVTPSYNSFASPWNFRHHSSSVEVRSARPFRLKNPHQVVAYRATNCWGKKKGCYEYNGNYWYEMGIGKKGIDKIKAVLSSGRPVAISMDLQKSFFRPKWPYGQKNCAPEVECGAHAMLAVGYTPSGLLLQNSWGMAWGYTKNGKKPIISKTNGEWTGRRGYILVKWATAASDISELWTADGLR